jgi:small subunit ribosomal protein S8
MASKTGKQESSTSPVSKVMLNVLEILQKNKYIGSFKVSENTKKKVVKVNLIGNLNKCGSIKPRFPVKINDFEKFEKRYLPAKDFGLILISTSQGIITHIEAKEKGIGGKLLAYVY